MPISVSRGILKSPPTPINTASLGRGLGTGIFQSSLGQSAERESWSLRSSHWKSPLQPLASVSNLIGLGHRAVSSGCRPLHICLGGTSPPCLPSQCTWENRGTLKTMNPTSHPTHVCSPYPTVYKSYTCVHSISHTTHILHTRVHPMSYTVHILHTSATHMCTLCIPYTYTSYNTHVYLQCKITPYFHTHSFPTHKTFAVRKVLQFLMSSQTSVLFQKDLTQEREGDNKGTRFQGKAGKESIKDEAGPQTENWVWALVSSERRTRCELPGCQRKQEDVISYICISSV